MSYFVPVWIVCFCWTWFREMSQIYNMAFLRRNLFCKVWPPELGLQFSTSVLCWSFADESFWRGPVCWDVRDCVLRQVHGCHKVPWGAQWGSISKIIQLILGILSFIISNPFPMGRFLCLNWWDFSLGEIFHLARFFTWRDFSLGELSNFHLARVLAWRAGLRPALHRFFGARFRFTVWV